MTFLVASDLYRTCARGDKTVLRLHQIECCNPAVCPALPHAFAGDPSHSDTFRAHSGLIRVTFGSGSDETKVKESTILPLIQICFCFNLLLYVIWQFGEEIITCDTLHLIYRIDKIIFSLTLLRLIAADEADGLRILACT